MPHLPALRWAPAALVCGCSLVIGDIPEPVGSESGAGGADAGDAGAAAGSPPDAAAGTGGGNDATGGSAAGVAGASGGVAGASGAGATSGTAGGGAMAGVGAAGGSGPGGSGGMGGCQNPCDCDEDGAMGEGVCGGGDCDDNDPDVKPSQTMYFAVPADNPVVGFDYDCSGAPTRDPALDVELRCATLALLNCNETAQGYVATAPPCGTGAAWGTCKKGALLCEEDPVEPNRIMLCK